MIFHPTRWAQLPREVARDIVADADKKPSPPALRDSEVPCFLDLCLHAITKPTRLSLDEREELSLGGALDAKDVFHDKDARPEHRDVLEKHSKKIASLVTTNTPPVVGCVHLPNVAEALARRSANNDINGVYAELRGEFIGRKLRKVFTEDYCFFGKFAL